MTVAEYFASVERGLRRSRVLTGIDESLVCLASDEYNGLLRCRARVSEASYLDIYEVISTELGYPVGIHYSYTFVRDGRLVLRYDNALHHPEVATHPHHLHLGPAERVSSSDQPSLSHILRQVESLLLG